MRLRSEDIIRIKDKLYLFANNMNMLYSIDIQTGEYDFLGKIPELNIFARRLISGIVEWNKTLYLLPLNSEAIWAYSIAENSWKKIDVKPYRDNWANSYFRNAVVYDEKMIIYGGYYPAILIMDLKTNFITYDEKPFKEMKKNGTKDLYFRGSPIHVGNSLYFASAVDNSILIYFLSDKGYEWKKIGNEKNRYSGIELYGNSFWLSPRESGMPIVKLTEGNVIEIFPTNEVGESAKYIGICHKDDGFIIPAGLGGKNSLIIDQNENIALLNSSYTVYKNQGADLLIQYSNGDVVFIILIRYQ